eukprot:TRINITY_DN27115_c0_g2_i1.p1 TRINITY_DN27115_c0_g2~~TRINITY_DN27115_c0_g2_i1.p1  ORF type:complete len:935 (+),score=266.75 TRINITY_DN27115_c0_g2_i1:46-2805(+)
MSVANGSSRSVRRRPEQTPVLTAEPRGPPAAFSPVSPTTVVSEPGGPEPHRLSVAMPERRRSNADSNAGQSSALLRPRRTSFPAVPVDQPAPARRTIRVTRPTPTDRLGVRYNNNVVSSVAEGLPAERSGLSEGAVMISIADRDVSKATTEGVTAAFTSAGAEFDVLVVPPVLVTRDDSREGFGVRLERGGYISAVAEGSPAQRAGLREGQQIVALSGQLVPASSAPGEADRLFGAAPLGTVVTISVLQGRAVAPALLADTRPSHDRASMGSRLTRADTVDDLLGTAGGRVSVTGIPRADRTPVDTSSVAVTAAVLWELTALAEAMALKESVSGLWDGVWPVAGHAIRVGCIVVILVAAVLVLRLWDARGLLLCPATADAATLARTLGLTSSTERTRVLFCAFGFGTAAAASGYVAYLDWDACSDPAVVKTPDLNSATRSTASNGCPPSALVWLPLLLGALCILSSCSAAVAVVLWVKASEAFVPRSAHAAANPLSAPVASALVPEPPRLQLPPPPHSATRNEAPPGCRCGEGDWARSRAPELLLGVTSDGGRAWRRSVAATAAGARRSFAQDTAGGVPVADDEVPAGAETPPTDVEEIQLEDDAAREEQRRRSVPADPFLAGGTANPRASSVPEASNGVPAALAATAGALLAVASGGPDSSSGSTLSTGPNFSRSEAALQRLRSLSTVPAPEAAAAAVQRADASPGHTPASSTFASPSAQQTPPKGADMAMLWKDLCERLADRGTKPEDFASVTGPVMHEVLRDLGYDAIDSARLQAELSRRLGQQQKDQARSGWSAVRALRDASTTGGLLSDAIPDAPPDGWLRGGWRERQDMGEVQQRLADDYDVMSGEEPKSVSDVLKKMRARQQLMVYTDALHDIDAQTPPTAAPRQAQAQMVWAAPAQHGRGQRSWRRGRGGA